jgi:hypothetical protein
MPSEEESVKRSGNWAGVVGGLALAAGVLAAPAGVGAIVVHPADDPGLPPNDRPPEGIVGRWGTNASAVAIGPNHILTTRHQGGGVGTTVVFGGVTYTVAEEIPIGNADLRVARVTGAGPLNPFAGLYTGTNEIGQFALLGGYGQGRGANLADATGTYGYQWDGTGNTTLRFGRNQIDSTDTTTPGDGDPYTSAVIVADFDPREALTTPSFEASLAEFDSGGGFFLFDGGVWKVAGINRGVEHLGRSIYRANLGDPDVPGGRDGPDLMDAVRVSSYAAQITAAVPEPSTVGVVMLAGCGLLARRRRV